MCLKCLRFRRCHSYQRGSALAVILFALVVMSALGLALVRLISSQSQQVISEVLAVQAMQAAQTAVEWRLIQLLPLSTAARHCDGTVDSNAISDGSSFNSSTSLNVDGLSGFNSCTPVTVECSSYRYGGRALFRLQATASCSSSGADGVSVSRGLVVEAQAL